ncbi:MAG: hypothetical protein JWP02_867, partial [Acidimicrobiales bacterium]|nr:hypothetical protein [Acidimicrobiales bacterium]
RTVVEVEAGSVVVVVEVMVVVDELVVEEDEDVVVFFLKPLLVGARKLNTKAATMPMEAMTASTLRPGDQRVSVDPSVGGGTGGSSDVGGGP